MTDQEKREWAIAQLRKKYGEIGRLPTKGDFSEADRCRIKAWLGPWPRALESAGLKSVSPRYLRRRKASAAPGLYPEE